MLGKIGLSAGRRSRRAVVVVTAAIFIAVGAHSISPRELYHQMYPLEPVKQNAFQICDETDPTFIRAVGSDREACYNKMPHVMAVAMGRVKPESALSTDALIDPAREAQLILMLASLPPQQPITEPRLFSNTAWVRALTPPCDGKPVVPAIAYSAPMSLPPSPGGGRAAALDSTIRGNLPPLLHGAEPAVAAQPKPLPIIALQPGQPAASQAADKTAAFTPLAAPDIGDKAPPAVVPLAPATSCSGA
jgi:hypothetical protein